MAMTYRVRFLTQIELTVEIDADDEDTAADDAWAPAEAYLGTLTGDGLHVVAASASLDGIGAEPGVEEVTR